MKKTALALIALLMGRTAHADDYLVMGSGQKTCGSFVSAIEGAPPGQYLSKGELSGELHSYQSWLMGFVSGINVERNDGAERQISNVDLPAVDLWMRNWCNRHPTKTVFEGALAFRREMLK